MAPEIIFDIERMKASIDTVADRLGSSRPLVGNREALKTMMFEIMNGLAGLVHTVGGSSLYVPDAGYLSDDIDNAFHDAIEAHDAAEPAPNMKRYGTLDHRTLGLRA
jgi:hypothetical protein